MCNRQSGFASEYKPTDGGESCWLNVGDQGNVRAYNEILFDTL